ncbi:hypothetical protein K470DRAFT_271488 [Piedraia hortae CBS 480.64]|uniref:Uncharacterized protein n=1 Tax=Piedraia hortae CBS 480.64 TaxID=1314780 RepID=A0A6A7BWK8_9PEZI|nr:hypothetical protein K470DRAFT_271488 [Piedraia hortae CBS 480.64]
MSNANSPIVPSSNEPCSDKPAGGLSTPKQSDMPGQKVEACCIPTKSSAPESLTATCSGQSQSFSVKKPGTQDDGPQLGMWTYSTQEYEYEIIDLDKGDESKKSGDKFGGGNESDSEEDNEEGGVPIGNGKWKTKK